MKNFRKVLALVLVVATLFSFAAMASAKYEDADKISYDEAVTVLSAVGILNGYEVAEDEFEFKPTNTISREEMAKMIAVLCNAGADVSKLYASACTFADVDKAQWSASYIAYCAQTGIVAGRTADTFDPYGKVTGLETAKMLLVALGFNAETQGYVGANWKINVLRDAKAMGMLKGFAAGYDIEAAITREEAAQMMLNTLTSNVVIGYLSDAAKVVVTNKLISDAGKLNWTLLDAKGEAALYGKVVISKDELGTVLFGLEKGKATTDCYGRPGYVWTLDGKVVCTVIDTPVWTSNNTDAAKIAKAAKDLDITIKDNYTNGSKGVTVNGGVGSVVELFEDGTIVEINTFLGEIGQINYAKGTFVLKSADGTTVRAAALNDYGFTREDEGSKVLYWFCNEKGLLNLPKEDDIHDVVKVDAKVVTVDAVREAAKNFCDTDETVYNYAEKNLGDLESAQKELTRADVAKELKVYTDLFGNVLAWAEYDGTEYAYSVLVNGTAKGTGMFIDEEGFDFETWTAKMVDFVAGATPTQYTVDVDAFDAAVLETSKHDILVKYVVDEDGRLEADATVNEAVATTGKLAPATAKFCADEKYLDNTSKIILRVWDYFAGAYEYKYFDGMDEIDATYRLNEIQYVAGNDAWVNYLYAEAKYYETANLAYVLGENTDETWMQLKNEDGNYETYYLYDAIVEGEAAIVAFKKPLTNTERVLYKANLALINAETHDGELIYKAGSEVTVANTVNFAIENGTLVYNDAGTLKGITIAADATILVMVYDATDDVVTAVPVAQDDVVNYISFHGYEQMGGYMEKNADGAVELLYIFVNA